MDKKKANAEALARFIERARQKNMFKKGPTWEELGAAVQGPSREQKLKDARDATPQVPTE